ncbi:MAG: outer membrane beta-barrel protein [Candidatus Krumholzibacteriota bacterium]|nr:outer membrane beta-barrel protein [Candidatus Krumholzibacteriota bacterium]
MSANLNHRSGGAGKIAVTITWVILGIAVFSPALAAEDIREDENGVCLGIALVGSGLHVDSEYPADFFIKDGGGGLKLDIGYRFNPVFTLEFGITGATHETSVQNISALISIAQFVGHYRFSPDRPFRPYLKGGFCGCSLELTEGALSARAEGGGVILGGGFKFFFTPHFSLGLDYTYNIIHFERAQLSFQGLSYQTEIDEEGAMSTLSLAFGYAF